jgi:hypothetical protein
MVWVVWTLAHNAWKNIVAVGKFFDGIKKEDGILWTMFRLGGVVNGGFSSRGSGWETETYALSGDFQGLAEGYVGDGKTTLSVRRSELSQWLVEQAIKEDPEWVYEKPMVSSPSKQKI